MKTLQRKTATITNKQHIALVHIWKPAVQEDRSTALKLGPSDLC